jgi:hypothetical protein
MCRARLQLLHVSLPQDVNLYDGIRCVIKCMAKFLVFLVSQQKSIDMNGTLNGFTQCWCITYVAFATINR